MKYTKREVKRADEVMKIRRRLSFPADETITKYQSIINIPVTRQDIVRSVDIYGKDRNSFLGKDTKKKTDTVYLESVYKPSDIAQHIHIDIFFIDGEGYLISVLTPHDFVMISRIKNRTSDSLQAALYHHLALLRVRTMKLHIYCVMVKNVFLPSSMNCVPQDISSILQDQVSTYMLSNEILELLKTESEHIYNLLHINLCFRCYDTLLSM